MTPAFAPERRRLLLSGAAALSLAGCGHVIGPVTLKLYRLEPVTAPRTLPAVAWRLAVATPEADEAFDTERIALTRGASTLDYFADAAWTDRVPELIQELLIRRFEDSGAIVAVARDTEALRADYLLQTELRDFEARYAGAGAPTVLARIEARLVRMPAREIMAHLTVDPSAPAAGDDAESVVQAFDQALGAALDQILAWTLGAPPPA
jgi:cholesterol transport system auxiliary component